MALSKEADRDGTSFDLPPPLDRHLGELQWIAVLTIILFSVGVLATTILIEKRNETWVLDNLKVIGGLAAVAAAVFSWAYQTGSRRLGVIDLFGCEISAICRMNLVVDFAKRQVEIAREGVPATVNAEVGTSQQQLSGTVIVERSMVAGRVLARAISRRIETHY